MLRKYVFEMHHIFFQSARKTNSRYLLNYFDSSVIELKTEDRFDKTFHLCHSSHKLAHFTIALFLK